MGKISKLLNAIALAQAVKALAFLLLAGGLCFAAISGGVAVDLSVKIGGKDEYNTRAY